MEIQAGQLESVLVHSSCGAEFDVNIRVNTRVLKIRDQRFIARADLLDILRLSHQSLESLAYSILCVLARAPIYLHSIA